VNGWITLKSGHKVNANFEKGFDFLGYHFCRAPLRVANVTIQKHIERIVRLYEQQKAKEPLNNS